ncbi:site-specific integrase [Cryobacterium sp. 10S3]|nr:MULTISPECIES: site-specific integrase [unclassified Cryobacterium]MEB0001660.1 site-specific integrase [Cryobacterium sp. RTC2.1]MEB0286691.1 site-specific integrase [Cryobacterium sp. 10S3]
MTIAGIRRERARPIDRRAPLLLNELRRTLVGIDRKSWPQGVIGQRDSALLLIGFGGAFRRSELASLELRDLRIHPEDGLYIGLRRSKTDQRGNGISKAIPFGTSTLTCAACAYIRWLRMLAAAERGLTDRKNELNVVSLEGHICRDELPTIAIAVNQPFFRPVMKNGAIKERHITGNVVYDVVKRRVGVAGYDPRLYGAHSLRAGFVTEAFRAGATHHEIMRQTGHRDPATAEIYSREASPLENNAVTRLGL